MPYWLEIVINLSFSFLATVGFAITINLPRPALIASGCSGALGWMTYWFLMQLGAGRVISNLFGAMLIGIIGIFFARWKKMPIILFNIPGIVPLVPGVPAYMAVRAMALGQLDEALSLLLRVAIICGAIAIGFMLAQLVSEIISSTTRRLRKQREL